MNTSIIVNSLRYLETFHIVSLSRWIYEELVKINYSDDKLESSLHNFDTDIVESIIHLNQDKSILNRYLVPRDYCDDDCDCNIRIPLLLKHGADVHTDMDYPLIWAAGNNHVDIVRILLDDYNVDVHTDNDSAIENAVETNNLEIILLLIEHGAKLDTELLVSASYYGFVEVVDLLLKEGVEINDDALIKSIRNSHIETIKTLLNHGADIHKNEDAAFIEACETGNLEIVRLLIESGADIRAQDCKGLRMLCQSNKTEIIEYLLAIGISVKEIFSFAKYSNRQKCNSFIVGTRLER